MKAVKDKAIVGASIRGEGDKQETQQRRCTTRGAALTDGQDKPYLEPALSHAFD
jgi:hypothetical protein